MILFFQPLNKIKKKLDKVKKLIEISLRSSKKLFPFSEH